jgi:hypothetical protein
MNKFRPKSRDIDKESRKPKLRRPNKVPDSSESENDLSSQSDSEVEKSHNMEVKDDSRRSNFSKIKRKVNSSKFTSTQKDQLQEKESKTTEVAISAAPHMIMTSAVYHLRIAPITYPQSSTYIPAFYMFYEVLNASHRCLNNNTYLKHIAPDYISVASSLYYAYLGYIQILRAKATVGIISRTESQCLRKFEREFPFESLAIMSPLILFFQNLGAAKLPDPMYSWICPTLPDTLGTDSNIAGIFCTNEAICLPNAPALLRFLFELGAAEKVADVTDELTSTLVPNSFMKGNSNFMGVDMGQSRTGTTIYQRITYSAGMLAPPEIPNSLDITNLVRIKRWNLPNITNGTDLRTIGQFLQTDGNFEWFKNLARLATAEARFFKGSTHLGNISPTTGIESLIEITYSRSTRPAAVDTLYPLSDPAFRNDSFRFQGITTRGETSPELFKVGATTQFLVTGYGNMVPQNHASPSPSNNGAYFDPAMNGRQVKQIESDMCRSPSYNFDMLIARDLYLPEGKEQEHS